MNKDNLKSIINKHVGYAEQEIYYALEEVYTKEEVIELCKNAWDRGWDNSKASDWGNTNDIIKFDNWAEQNL